MERLQSIFVDKNLSIKPAASNMKIRDTTFMIFKYGFKESE